MSPSSLPGLYCCRMPTMHVGSILFCYFLVLALYIYNWNQRFIAWMHGFQSNMEKATWFLEPMNKTSLIIVSDDEKIWWKILTSVTLSLSMDVRWRVYLKIINIYSINLDFGSLLSWMHLYLKCDKCNEFGFWFFNPCKC